MSSFQFEQIGVIRSPYKEKFAVPRQPGLVKSANGELHLIAPYNQADAVRGTNIQPFMDPFRLSSNDGRRLASDCASASSWR